MPGLITLLTLGLLLAALLGVRWTYRTLRHPPRRTYAWALARGRPGDPSELPTPRVFRAWTFVSRGLTLPAWDLVGDRPSGPTIIVTHGWGDSRVTMLERADRLATLASRLVVWDLPGHGEAPGICALGAREAEDLASLARAVADGTPLVLYGFSLGAGVSIEVAAAGDPPVAGVIAEAPYRLAATPARNVLRAMGMPYRWNLPAALWLINRREGGRLTPEVFDRASVAARMACPLLVLHGDLDAISPPEDGRAVAEAGRGEMAEVEGGAHLNLWADPGVRERTAAAVVAFLARLEA